MTKESAKNENYPLAANFDPDFDKPHVYAKCNGDGSTRHHCRCERHKDNPIHVKDETQ